MMSVILVAFLVNIVLVLFRKWTKIRTVFLTGHIMVLQASTALWVVLYCFPHLQDIKIIFLMGGLLGVYWSVFSNLTVEPAQHLTEGMLTLHWDIPICLVFGWQINYRVK